MADPADGDPIDLDWGDRAPRGTEAGAVEPASTHLELAPRANLPARRDRGSDPRRGAGHGAPGEPAEMPEGLFGALQDVFSGPGLRVQQVVEMGQLVGWDQANRYQISTLDGRMVLRAEEASSGAVGALSRNFNPFYVNTTELSTPDGTVVMKVAFPWTLIFKRGEVRAWDGRPMGMVRQRFSILRTRIDVVSPGGNTLLEIWGPVLKFFSFSDWVFEVRQHGRTVARIKRHWSGWRREMFTNADRFSIEFDPGFADGRLRQLVICAALAVDQVRFERKSKSSRGLEVGLIDKLLG